MRSAYYKQLSEPWASLRSDLENPNKVKCPHPQTECDTFEKLRAELDDEFLWVQEVQNFASHLLEPYEGDYNTRSSRSTTTSKASIPPPASAKVNLRVADDRHRRDAHRIRPGHGVGQPELAGVFGVLGGAGSLATDVMETQNAAHGAPASADTLSGTADRAVRQAGSSR